jgi:hypothetical protein
MPPMKAVITVILMVIVIPVVALTVLPLSRYVSSERETLEMDDAARRSVTGSFVRLTDGVTHYQIGGPARGGDPAPHPRLLDDI